MKEKEQGQRMGREEKRMGEEKGPSRKGRANNNTQEKSRGGT